MAPDVVVPGDEKPQGHVPLLRPPLASHLSAEPSQPQEANDAQPRAASHDDYSTPPTPVSPARRQIDDELDVGGGAGGGARRLGNNTRRNSNSSASSDSQDEWQHVNVTGNPQAARGNNDDNHDGVEGVEVFEEILVEDISSHRTRHNGRQANSNYSGGTTNNRRGMQASPTAPARAASTPDEWLKGTFFDPNSKKAKVERKKREEEEEQRRKEREAAEDAERAAAEARRAAAAARLEEERRRKQEAEARKAKKREKAQKRKEEEEAKAANRAHRSPPSSSSQQQQEGQQQSQEYDDTSNPPSPQCSTPESQNSPDVLMRANVEAAEAAAAAAQGAMRAGDMPKAARMAEKASRLAPSMFAHLPAEVNRHFGRDTNHDHHASSSSSNTDTNTGNDNDNDNDKQGETKPDKTKPDKPATAMRLLIRGVANAARKRYTSTHLWLTKKIARKRQYKDIDSKFAVAAHAVLVLSAVLGAGFTFIVVRLALFVTIALLSLLYDSSLRIPLDLFVWNPCWFVTLPVCIGMAIQRRFLLLTALWPFLLLFWMCGGGGYSLAGGALALFSIVTGISNFWTFLAAWFVFGWAHYFLPWYLWVPIGVVTLVAWLLFGTAGSGGDGYGGPPPTGPPMTDGEVLLSTDVPKGAEGEIARVLACDDYFKVLQLEEVPTRETSKGREVDMEAVATMVKKAHRRLILKVHPDKCGGAVGCEEACRRVQTASEILSDEYRLKEYAAHLYALRTGTDLYAEQHQQQADQKGSTRSRARKGGAGSHRRRK